MGEPKGRRNAANTPPKKSAGSSSTNNRRQNRTRMRSQKKRKNQSRDRLRCRCSRNWAAGMRARDPEHGFRTRLDVKALKEAQVKRACRASLEQESIGWDHAEEKQKDRGIPRYSPRRQATSGGQRSGAAVWRTRSLNNHEIDFSRLGNK